MGKGFQTAPEDQGQIVEVSYACAGEAMVRRIYDRGDQSTEYEMAGIWGDDWSWYQTYDAVNGPPPLTEWRPISAAHAAQLMDADCNRDQS